MVKILQGKIINAKMQDTAVVEIIRFVRHPLYKKLLKRSKQYKVAINGQTLVVGDRVKIAETRPVSKDKYFKVLEVLKK